MLTHLRQRVWTATVSVRRYGLYLPIRSIIVCGKSNNPISADRPLNASQWRDVTGLPRGNGLDVISSGDVSTGTEFCSVAKSDLHSAMLMAKRTNKRCYVLEGDRSERGGGQFGGLGWKNGWPEDVLCCHARQFQCIISTIDVLRPHAIPLLHNKVPASLTNMMTQDPITLWLFDSFWHKITLMFFRVLPYLLIRSHFDLNQKMNYFYT